MNDLQIATKAVKLAAERLNSLLGKKILVTSSINKDIKLQADKESENVIIQFLKNESNYAILSEELPEKIEYNTNNYIWIIDPLDGSLNFSRGIPFYCISIGLWKNGQPILGVIYDLVAKNIYWGEIKQGAFCNNESIHTSNVKNISDAVVSTGFPVYTDFEDSSLRSFIDKIQKFKKVRLFGSAALSITLVAAGAVDVYSEENIAIWDVAGALAILKASGGEFSISKGKSKNLVNVYATNGKIQ